MWVLSLGEKDPLEKVMTTHSSILVWRLPWTGEPGWLQSMKLHGYDLVTKCQQHKSIVIRGKGETCEHLVRWL